MSNVVDLVPRLSCKHEHVSVGVTEKSLTCDECGVELDPWWWIRREAEAMESLREETDRIVAAKIVEFNAGVERMNTRLRGLAEEIDKLTATKNRLMNESVNGQHVGMAARRRRKP